MTTYNIGDAVIIDNILTGDASSKDERWCNDETVLKVMQLRTGDGYDLVVGLAENNQSAVKSSWLRMVKAKKHITPENAISRVQALKLGKQLYPDATHIGMCKDGAWYLYNNVTGITGSAWTSTDVWRIHVPIKYKGPWETSTYPKTYFSPAETFQGLGHSITIQEDGSIKLGCGDVIPSDTIDAIIKHRIDELDKFPKTRKKKND